MKRHPIVIIDQLTPPPIRRDSLLQSEHRPPEEHFGGGDICSLEEQPSIDDDKPLD
ncbi:hypothetical protein AB8B02_03040 [Tardiphaga sp. 862_B3_N4_1]|jgi:hypothetical protein|uniref:hypothetical protein n=1 Tax=unclassified Tardiphaga TaxID=2631404 RepID=UPI003F1F2AB9